MPKLLDWVGEEENRAREGAGPQGLGRGGALADGRSNEM